MGFMKQGLKLNNIFEVVHISITIMSRNLLQFFVLLRILCETSTSLNMNGLLETLKITALAIFMVS